jgi:hypothetical protein
MEEIHIMRNHTVSKQVRHYIQIGLMILTVAGVINVTAPAAKADTFDFTVVDSASHTIQFSIDAAAPVTAIGGGFQVNAPVAYTLNTVAQGSDTMQFYDLSSGGGLMFGSIGQILNLYGPAVFAGTDSAPSFLVGTYNFSGYTFNNQNTAPYSLTITQTLSNTSPVPEPADILLFGTGLLALAAVVISHKRGMMAFSQTTQI